MFPVVPGLSAFPDFVTAAEGEALCRHIDNHSWRHDLKRRVQHYGYLYDYAARSIGPDAYLGPLPEWLEPVLRRLTAPEYLGAAADQVIVNEYVPGQGISGHVDCVPCFGPRIAILSLGSPCVMVFAAAADGRREALLLPALGLTVLSGAARYDWTHEIPARKSDVVDGVRVPRGRRVSVTFRTVRPQPVTRSGPCIRP